MLRCVFAAAVLAGAISLYGLVAQARAVGSTTGEPRPYTMVVSQVGEPELSLYAEERGTGAPVVLIHGLGGSTYSWRFIAPVLARSHRVIALDLKGFGRSSKAFDTQYAAADQARLVATFLARRNLSGVTLVGHSFGGQVALLTALEMNRRGTQRVAQLVLIDAPALPQKLSPLVAFMQQPVLPYALLTAIPSPIVTRLALAPTSLVRLDRAYTDDDAEAYAAPFLDAAARHAYIQTARQIAPGNLATIIAAYRAVRQRTLLVWCSRDDVVPVSTGRRLAQMLPNAHLREISGCNHAPPDEAPDALARELTRFLNHR
jgi:pimeloyl-ACP methyl ester carboxylesterase